MYTCPLQLSDVRYNAASQAFEATVTVHDNATVRRYACAIEAPISMTPDAAARGLAKQAIRRHQTRGGLFSQVSHMAARTRTTRQDLAPMRWLRTLAERPEQKAA